MNLQKKLSILSLSFFILFGCGGGNENTENPAHADEKSEKEAKKTSKEHDHEGHEHGEHPALELNDGEKWEADSSTKAGVEKMDTILEGSASSDELEAYHELGDSLQAEFDQIFKHCSMEGPGHDQLHNFLLPIKNDIQGLHSKKLKEAQAARDSIEKRLPKFEEYFE